MTESRQRPAKPPKTREEKIDRQVEDSFPASDPPSYSGGGLRIGAPAERESVNPDNRKSNAAEPRPKDDPVKKTDDH